MKKRMYPPGLALTLLAITSTYSLPDVNFIVTGIEHSRGSIDIRIYTDAKSWLKTDQILEHIVIPAQEGEVTIQLEKFHGGILAASVYHDENGDGKLNTGLFWRPKEGFAFSNEYEPKAMPQFSKAAIEVPNGDNVVVRLNY